MAREQQIDADWLQEFESLPERTPEQELFWAVLLQAFNDMRNISYRPPSHCRDARRWLLLAESDFQFVCALAGVNHRTIHSIALRYEKFLQEGNTPRALPLKPNE